ncbi:nicotinate phosphoribosyltransferase [Tistrella sp. BH-R2-4]|uniref:Nicotinate phosphoribosyltransferase n=2 Tax=Tistrella TaxID=171436 RepID=A0ABU9YD64_9PROT|nr:nicotinate phosphoribosyltransferase [Tistrella bauzanensis]GGB49181.1 nicotinate phosphoribosyltransferase [Tistrella bauzanensis]
MPASNDFVAAYTDVYFKRTRRIVERFGDRSVTYAVFMRRPVLATLKLAIDWIEAMARLRGVEINIEPCHEEGSWVGAGEPLMYLTGPMSALVELETVYLQRIGAPCVAAYYAWSMAVALPKAAFLAMDARHCAGAEMAEMMAYAASVGSIAAQAEGAVGFVGNATDATAVHFGNAHGFGTMPHALIGYAGSTLRAAEMFVDTFPGDALTVLVDYYGAEITDALTVCRRFPEMAAAGKLSVRLDTHGGRFLEGLDPALSYEALERNRPDAIRRYRSETELKWLLGPGVSAAAIFQMRNALDDAGFDKVRIVASSGFGPEKCRVMGSVEAPIDVVGTGSFLPEKWSETYATADIVSYDGRESVKVGREFLLPSRRPRR